MTDVIMPKMGDGMEEGTLLEWLKKDGDSVKSGEVIGTIQTDKATLELEAPASGRLTGLKIKDGDTVPVGQSIAVILRDGEAISEGGKASNGPQVDVPAALQPKQSPSAPVPTEPAADSERLKASPLAKRIASERGIDLTTIKGSGPGGRIVERDIPDRAPVAKGVPAPATVVSAEDTSVPLSRLNIITGQRTLHSKQTVPHFYVTLEVDVERILELRSQFEQDGAPKPSINDFVVRACALALRDMPDVNASFGDKVSIRHGAVNIGMAVAVPDGLTVPVLKNADRLTLGEISLRAKDLARKARENTLSPDELSGSTFSISNMGMLDVDEFVAIINAPNGGIVAIASARKRVVATEDGEIEIRTKMNVTGSFDHRIVDGAGGAKFMNIVRSYLESPTRLLS